MKNKADPRRVSQAKLDRLRANLQSVREYFEGCKTRFASQPGAWWLGAAERSLANAQTGLDAGDLDGGWGAVHDAERFLVFSMSDDELILRTLALKEETAAKLRGWRARATANLLATAAWAVRGNSTQKPGLSPDQRALLEQVVVQSMAVMHGHSDNIYHQLHQAGGQLRWLVWICTGLILLVLALSAWFAPVDSDFGLLWVLPVAIAGALGGTVSAMYQLRRAGEERIPESLLQNLITSGRPLVGAASALFIYAVIQSKLISLIDASNVTLAVAVVLGFVAGFSEKFVLGAVAKVAGEGTSEPRPVGPMVVGEKAAGNRPGGAGDAGGPASRQAATATARTPTAKKKTA